MSLYLVKFCSYLVVFIAYFSVCLGHSISQVCDFGNCLFWPCCIYCLFFCLSRTFHFLSMWIYVFFSFSRTTRRWYDLSDLLALSSSSCYLSPTFHLPYLDVRMHGGRGRGFHGFDCLTFFFLLFYIICLV